VVHEVAAEGFNDPADYEAARPSYPPDAVAWLAAECGIRAGAHVVDVAAGTGKLTRLLAPTGAALVAIEPVEGMRATFRSMLPDIPVLAGTAEALPLRAGSVDAITVAQAWHWFDHERATAEAARAIKPGGALGLVWNARPFGRLGRRDLDDHGSRREARAVARPRELARQRARPTDARLRTVARSTVPAHAIPDSRRRGATHRVGEPRGGPARVGTQRGARRGPRRARGSLGIAGPDDLRPAVSRRLLLRGTVLNRDNNVTFQLE